jgi:hypothetical protein
LKIGKGEENDEMDKTKAIEDNKATNANKSLINACDDGAKKNLLISHRRQQSNQRKL